MALELAQVVAQLVEAIGAIGEMEGCEDSLVDLFGRPAADVSAAVQQDLEQADDAHLVDFDAGIAHRADGDRQRDALQQREVDVNVGRVVTIGQLTLFSSETGDAWIVDRDDHLALRLARQGAPEPFHIEETDTSFAIDWKGHYRIEDAAFIYTDRETGRTTTVLGYPIDKLAKEA